MDFDGATLGIFVNNLTYQPRYDYYFAKSGVAQNEYRAAWSAFALPSSVLVSGVQQLLRIPYYRVDRLLKITCFVLGLLGSLCAANIARGAGVRWFDAAFVAGFVAVSPAYLLYLRTAFLPIVTSFSLFWAAVMLMVAYTRDLGRRRLYGVAIVLACYGLAPYAALTSMPVVLLGIVLIQGRLGRTMRDPHFYAAAAIGVVAWWSVVLVLAVHYDGSYQNYMSKVSEFLMVRGPHVLSFDGFTWSELRWKLVKLVDQHVLFLRDALGDAYRPDDLWTLNAVHVTWLGLLPLTLYGVYRGLAAGDEATRLSALVLATTYVMALTVGSPEGRYIVTAVPCYALLLGVAARTLLPNPTRRMVALALILLVTATNTYWLVGGRYETDMMTKWKTRAAMREALAAIRVERAHDEEAYLEWPALQYKDWLYLQMLANFEVVVLERMEMVRMASAPKDERHRRAFFIARDADARPEIRGLRLQGFELVGEVTDSVSARRLAVLVKHVPPIGESPGTGT